MTLVDTKPSKKLSQVGASQHWEVWHRPPSPYSPGGRSPFQQRYRIAILDNEIVGLEGLVQPLNRLAYWRNLDHDGPLARELLEKVIG